MLNAALSIGFAVPKNSDYKYIRDTFWPNVRRAAIIIISRDGGKWWSKDHHLMVVKIIKNVDFSLKNVKKW